MPTITRADLESLVLDAEAMIEAESPVAASREPGQVAMIVKLLAATKGLLGDVNFLQWLIAFINEGERVRGEKPTTYKLPFLENTLIAHQDFFVEATPPDPDS